MGRRMKGIGQMRKTCIVNKEIQFILKIKKNNGHDGRTGINGDVVGGPIKMVMEGAWEGGQYEAIKNLTDSKQEKKKKRGLGDQSR